MESVEKDIRNCDHQTNTDDPHRELFEPMVFSDRPIDLEKEGYFVDEKVSSSIGSSEKAKIYTETESHEKLSVEKKGDRVVCFDGLIKKTSDTAIKSEVSFKSPFMGTNFIECTDLSDGGTKSSFYLQSVTLPSTHIGANVTYAEKSNSRSKVSICDTTAKFLSIVPVLVIAEKFYIYNGIFYEFRTQKEIARLIVNYCRDEVQRSDSPKFVDAVVDLISKEPSLEVKEDEHTRRFIAFRNTVLDILTAQADKHNPEFRTLYMVNGNYFNGFIPHTPQFDNFIFTITGGDPSLVDRIWQMIGYILTPDTSAKVFFLLQGVPDSGKSLLVKLISKLLSENSVTTLDAHDFNDKFAVSDLVGRILCISPDMTSAPLDARSVSKIKQLTGNDVVSSDQKFRSRVKFQCQAKLILVTNHALLTRTPDAAFYKRIVTIPFRYVIPNEMQDQSLFEKLFFERDGIISKAIDAYFDLRDRNYRFAGDYQPNDVIADSFGDSIDHYGQVFQFTKSNFDIYADGTVFTQDAWELYKSQYGDIPRNVFAGHFIRSAEEIFHAKKDRERKESNGNALSCMKGICRKV